MTQFRDLFFAERAAVWGKLALVMVLTVGAPSVMSQTISDVPLAVKNNVPPNMMFMLDNSGSMSNIVVSAPYDASTTYACTGTAVSTAHQVDIDITSGNPYFTANGTRYRHGTVGSGSNPAARCFTPGGNYMARLYGGNSGDPGNYLPAEYTGHYLNWYFGNYDGPVTGWIDRKRLTTGSVRTRMQVAQSSATSVINGLPLVISGTTNPALRIGLSTYYNSSDGGLLLSSMGDFTTAKRTSVLSSINALAPDGQTPLAETLADIGRYMATGWIGNVTHSSVSSSATTSIGNFLRQDSRLSCLSGATCTTTTSDTNATPSVGTPTRPIQYWCQKSYVFMMTDGRPQGDQAFSNNAFLRDYDGDCSGANSSNCSGGNDRKTAQFYESAGSDYLDDVAKALYDIDLRPNLPGPNDPITGLPITKKNNLITYMIGFADSTVLNDPLVTRAAAQGGGRFLSATDEAGLTTQFNAALTDAFAKDAAAAAVAVANAQITVSNIGYASSYNSGSWYGELEAYSLNTTTGLQTTSTAAWSAQTQLDARSAASRKIASFDGSVGLPFTGANFNGVSGLTTSIIDYLRGDRTGEGSTFRSRPHVLGDIVNAEPVVATYSDVPIIFQGANDGMLHVFDGRVGGTGGAELWAYVPRLLHANLPLLTQVGYSHHFYVDGTPAIADITGAGLMTRLLVGGLGKGGRGYYALDVTSYTAASEAEVAAKVKWEFSPANMGYSFGTPLIVRTAAGWRVVVASGYDNGTAGGGDGQGYVWVLDPATGAVVGGPIPTGFGSAVAPSGLAHLSKLANTTADAEVRYVYGGDLLGNVFRFDLVSMTSTRIATLTDGSGNYQPITAPLEIGRVAGAAAKFFVYAGTGRYLTDPDIPGTIGANTWATQRQSMYGIIDDTANATPTLPNIRGTNGATCPVGGGSSDFVCQTATLDASTNTYGMTAHPVNTTTKRGWYVDLPMSGGRVIGKPALTTGGTLAFTVNVPSNTRCEPGGSSWFFALDAASGSAVVRVAGGNTYYTAGISLGTALASRPVIVTTATGKRALIRMSDKSVRNPDVPERVTTSWKRIYWRKLN